MVDLHCRPLSISDEDGMGAAGSEFSAYLTSSAARALLDAVRKPECPLRPA
jgi:hypothetical protein